MKKFILRTISFILVVYVGACTYMYFCQEEFIFHPKKLKNSSGLHFSIPFTEINLAAKGAILNGALFKSKESKGLIFFLHGNAGNLLNQDDAAKFYTQLGYDFFTFDYRGYGKSTNEISSEKQFFDDVQIAYDFVKKQYSEKLINVVGYSVGTASAAMISSKNNPSRLLLIAPYFSLLEMTTLKYKIIPTFLLEYKFETNKYLERIKNPVLLIHGDKDEVLPFEGSIQLSKLLNKKSKFLPIKGQGHNNFEENTLFQKNVAEFLK